MPNQIERIITLSRIIGLGRGECDVAAIAAETSSSVKTVRRDIEAARRLGIPITDQVHAHGRKTYSIAVDALQRVNFCYDEAFAIMLCRGTATAFEGTSLGQAADAAFEKIEASLGTVAADYLATMLPKVHQRSVGGDYTQHGEIVDALMIGMESRKATFISYHSARSTEPVTYDIHPYAVAEHQGTLYVVGHSCEHHEIRTWKVERISDAEVTPVPFVRPAGFDIKTHMKGAFGVVSGQTPVTVRVRFTGSAARYAAEKLMHPSQQVVTATDGTAVATFRLTSTLEIKSWIQSFGPAAEVLEPEELQQEIIEELKQSLAQYESAEATK
ncbi:putative DNA-binding transcriptional regulator YafY [Rhodopirellula rubra]|uniref:Putative DNA-binding transcriptional regulator YafY n=1 Tax=Aporhodopirellula rubra TaxID=980271 RepID=A0A7W5H7R2_9BACT|nr:WYL domain-containing protein [Aporhodopirellula rubra]MBB3208221.1 putative DNA-binding transcriptional regulator YafY [Aporhodopirellula rubra]